MNVLDIILGAALVYALYKGFKDGVVVQLGGIAAVIAGVWLAYRYCGAAGAWMKVDPQFAAAAGFAVIFIAVVLTVSLAAWCAGKILNLIGLGLLNKMGGAVLSLCKTVIILGVLIWAFNHVNEKAEIVNHKYIAGSEVYRSIDKVTQYVFPFLGKSPKFAG